MQGTLDFWRRKCTDVDKKTITLTEVQQGRKQPPSQKVNAAVTTKKKGRARNIPQIQGQINIKSFLEPKSNSMTPSVFKFPNYSTINENTATVGLSETLMGNKTTEASNVTGGQAQQLSETKL